MEVALDFCRSYDPPFNYLGACIGLGFQDILKDFLMVIKSCGIQSRLLWNIKKSHGIQSRQSRFFFQGNQIPWYSIKIRTNL